MPVLAIVTRKAGSGAGADDDDGALVEAFDTVLPFDKPVVLGKAELSPGGSSQKQSMDTASGQDNVPWMQ